LPDEFAVGMVFLQRGQEAQAIDAIRAAVAKFDLCFLGWRTVPSDPSILGPRSRDSPLAAGLAIQNPLRSNPPASSYRSSSCDRNLKPLPPPATTAPCLREPSSTRDYLLLSSWLRSIPI
jgi:hypothetical protein